MARLTPDRRAGRNCVLSIGALLLASPLVAQDYRDFELVRNRKQPYQSLLQLRLGYSGTEAEGKDDLVNGHASDDTIDGFLYYHSKNIVRGEDWILDIYGGLDGGYLGLKGDLAPGKASQSRIELFGRHTVFYRPGYYERGKFLRVGDYEGQDYGIRIGTAQEVDRGLLLDFAAFYKKYDFSDNDVANNFQFTLPDDHAGYGGMVTLEQNTINVDRQLGIPREGTLWTVRGEYERNDSENRIGEPVAGLEKLAKAYYRFETRLETYVPNGRTSAWVIFVDGGFYDSTDFLRTNEAQKVQGHIWGDGSVGYRMAWGESFLIKPFLQLQYSKRLDDTGVSSREKVFWGGGVQGSWLLYDKNLALVFDYSYVDNPSRSHVSIERDLFGEHQFFIGMDVAFGSGYRAR